MTTPEAPGAPAHRPDPARWIWYAMGGRLPSRYRAWILRDATGKGWALRHVVRAAVQLGVPITLVLLLLPGPLWIRAAAAVGGTLMGLVFSLAYMTETVEHRVRRAGYPPGLAEAMRARAAGQREAAASARRREAGARRADRRGRSRP